MKLLSFFSIVIVNSILSFGQTTHEYYLDDSIQKFFKSLPDEEGRYYKDLTNLKDSLSDGVYIFYDVKRKDAKKGNIWIKGQYKNGVKEGLFEKNFYVGRGKKSQLRGQHLCTYKNGLKHGIDQEYNLSKGAKYEYTKNEFHRSNNIQLNTYAEYKFGKLDGLYMFFNNGHPIRVYVYENDILKTVLKEVYVDDYVDFDKYNLEKEKILNVIINSNVFDSIYTGNEVCFKLNDLLSKNTPLKLIKKSTPVKIEINVNDTLDYIVIGDFTMARVDPKHARVQVTNPNRKLDLNLDLDKINDEWVITGHVIMED